MNVLWYGAKNRLDKASKVWSGYADYIISIGDPLSDPPPFSWRQHPHSKKLRLEFYDFDNPVDGGPTKADVEKLIAFSQARDNKGYALVHCQAGISRSSAASIILESIGKDEKQAKISIGRFLTSHPTIHPNFRMLILADEITNNAYRFVRAYLEHENQFIASFRKRYRFDDLYKKLRKTA